MNTENKLRAIIRQLINENASQLDEAQKGRQYDMYLKHTLSKMQPEVPEGQFDNINIMKEVTRQLEVKLGRILSETFEYKDFHIVRLGNFVIKTNDGETKLSFIKEGEENIRYSYPYVYIYHDTVEVVRFGSRFFEPDELLIKAAKEFMEGKIKLVTKTEQGQIIINNNFDTDNVIDLVDWKKVKRPEAPKADLKPKAKVSYRPGAPIKHPVFGNGTILKTRSAGVDAEGSKLYDVTANFNGKEKTIRMKSKAQPKMA